MSPSDRNIQTFYLLRVEDPSGVSGTGLVAEGVVFTNGKVALSFLSSDVKSIVTYDSIEDAEKIHGHGGLTKVVYDNDHDLTEQFKDFFQRIVSPMKEQTTVEEDVDDFVDETERIRKGPAGKNGSKDT